MPSLKRAGAAVWQLETGRATRVPAMVVASEDMLPSVRADEESLRQLGNVASLPGIVGAAWAMPDVHMGYGFPIGGVAATDAETGVISPGGVGYDINCGVRLLAFDLNEGDLRPRLHDVAGALFDAVPCGLGRGGSVKAGPQVLRKVLRDGARWAVDEGFGPARDLEFIEEGGWMRDADPSAVSERALARGKDQLGTLGSGNHFLEVGVVEAIYDAHAAAAYGLRIGQVTLLLHTGSRGLGHQVCTDALGIMRKAMARHGVQVPDPQLACVPLQSSEGRQYLGAMNAAVNFAFANRQILAAHAVRAMASTLGLRVPELGARTVYEVAHNIAKMETHAVDGSPRRVCVHRKGATRAFPPGHPDVPAAYRAAGQPVLIPGDMERYSYVLAGRPGAMETTFGSSCHGAGRRLSRTKARKEAAGRSIQKEMATRGILLRAASKRTQEEEIAAAYKDVAEVVEAVAEAGLSAKVARLRPIAVIKG